MGADAPDAPDTTSDHLSLTHHECISRLEEITTEVQRLAAKPTRSVADESYLAELENRFQLIDTHRMDLETRDAAARMEHRVGSLVRGRGANDLKTDGPGGVSSSHRDYDRDAILEPDSIEDKRFRNPWDLSEIRTFGKDPAKVTSELRSRALSAVEKMQGTSDAIRSTATNILERWDDVDGRLSRQALITSSPAYLRGWSKIAVDPMNPDLTVEEKAAMAEARTFQRAMSLADTAGGYLVPFQLDPTVILTSAGSYNEIRKIARTVIATGDVWHGVSAGAVSWSFDKEADEVSDDSPTFAGPSVTIRTARGFVPISLEARLDAANITQEVGMLLAQGKDDLESRVFITGIPTNNEPNGLLTALAANPASIVAASTDDTFAFNDVYNVQGALPARYRRQASWLAANRFWNMVRQAAPSLTVWHDPTGDRQAQFIGSPVYEAEAMASTITPAAHNYMAVYGDFSGYVVADRIGMTVDFIPHLFGKTNNFPTGQSGWFAYYRVGADITNPGAFRVLDI